MLVDSLLNQRLGMTGILRQLDVVIEPLAVKDVLNLAGQVLLVALARDRVDDESYLQLAHVALLCR